jgi:hypothetical protein
MHFFNVSVVAIPKMRAELRRERRGLPIHALAQIRRDAPLELSFLVDLSELPDAWQGQEALNENGILGVEAQGISKVVALGLNEVDVYVRVKQATHCPNSLRNHD